VAENYRSRAGEDAVHAMYRAVLQRWPVPYRHVMVATREGETSVIVSGDADAAPMVLFHGAGTNATAWIREVAEWSQHHCVYAIDMIGEPGLSAPSRPPLASERYAMWLDEVWNQLGLERASVVGVSLGGWLALEYAVRRPGKVTSISLLSPSGIGGQNLMTLVKLGLLRMCGTWGLRKSFALVAGREVPKALSEAITTMFKHFRPRRERIPIRTDEELARLNMPVQLILGGRDVLLRSDETRRRMEQQVRQLRVTYLENEGHILPPQTRAVLEFVNATVAGPVAGSLLKGRQSELRAHLAQSSSHP
jgi:pimeloyl-ACP methyl ester carboxylesterase